MKCNICTSQAEYIVHLAYAHSVKVPMCGMHRAQFDSDIWSILADVYNEWHGSPTDTDAIKNAHKQFIIREEIIE